MNIKRTIELSLELDRALLRLAESGRQTPSEIIERALLDFLHDAAETAEDQTRWSEYLKDRKAVPLASVQEWVESWDTTSEEATPEP